MRSGSNIVIAFVAAIATAPESHAQSEADRAGAGAPSALVQTLGIPTSGVELGLGWDSKKGRVVPNRCVDFAPVQERGQGVTLDMHEVSDQSEVMESLGVSASVAVRTLFVSGSAQASFAKQSKVNATSTSLMLRAIVDNGVLFAGPRRWQERARFSFPTIPEDGEAPPASGWKEWAEDRSGQERYAVGLKRWASDILTPEQSGHEKLAASDASGVQAFQRYCGDSYVSAIYSGAELLAMITFRASSREDKRAITASLKAQFGPVEMSASAAEKRNERRENTDLEVSYMQIGGGSGIIPTTHDDLVQKLKTLPAEAAREPKFRAMEVTPYTNLPEWRWDTSSSSVDADNEPYADFYWFLTSFDDDIEAVLQEPGDFSFRSGCILPELRRLQDDLLDVRRTIRVGVHGLQTEAGPSDLSDDARRDLSDARYAFFGQRDLDLSVLGADSKDSEPGPDAATLDYNAFAKELTDSMPEGNPNVLRLVLPLPTAVASAAEGAGKRDYLRLVIDHYIRPQAKRMCALEPTDNECLGNAEMEELTEYIPYNGTTLPDRAVMLIQSVADGTCLYLQGEKESNEALRTGDCVEALERDKAKFVRAGPSFGLAEIRDSCVGIDGDDRVTHEASCDQSKWEFTSGGLIVNDDLCITTQGPGQEAVVTTCSPSAADSEPGEDDASQDETSEDQTGEDETARVTQRWRTVPADDDSLRKLTEACSFRLGS